MYPTGYNTQLPGHVPRPGRRRTARNLGTTAPFILDGRWLHAFNGPGMTTNAVHANFRYNGLSPNTTGMDEDYDAVDLENWFLAMQSADGSVIIPSFHRPAAIRIDPNAANGHLRLGTAPNAALARRRPGPTRPRGSSAPGRPTATTRRPSPTWFPTPPARSPTTWTTTATA